MEVASWRLRPQGLEIVGLELLVLPRPPAGHVSMSIDMAGFQLLDMSWAPPLSMRLGVGALHVPIVLSWACVRKLLGRGILLHPVQA